MCNIHKKKGLLHTNKHIQPNKLLNYQYLISEFTFQNQGYFCKILCILHKTIFIVQHIFYKLYCFWIKYYSINFLSIFLYIWLEMVFCLLSTINAIWYNKYNTPTLTKHNSRGWLISKLFEKLIIQFKESLF